ncbi:enoyl-CoA hydratase-related protein [soil metagenome]
MTETDGAADPLVLSRCEDGVARITLNRPSRLNAFAGSMREELADAIETAVRAASVRVIVISGSGRAFSAGADIEVMAGLLERGDEDAFIRNLEAGERVVRAIATAPQPVIAALNGAGVGAGASLAIACDLRIASEKAKIGFTFNRIGLHPDWGATHFLPRLVGSGRAAELIFSARIIDAREARDAGIFGEVVADGDFRTRVTEVAREMAGKAPIALAAVKRTLASGDGAGALDAALRQEREAQLFCFRSSDVREGIAAFREKRSPLFEGR